MRPLSSLPNLARDMMFKPKYQPIVISSTKTNNTMITHNQLMRYLALQYIGHVNMNDLQRVHKLTGLSTDDIKYI